VKEFKWCTKLFQHAHEIIILKSSTVLKVNGVVTSCKQFFLFDNFIVKKLYLASDKQPNNLLVIIVALISSKAYKVCTVCTM